MLICANQQFVSLQKQISMLQVIKGTYENGKIILGEDPPVKTTTQVLITFLTEENNNDSKNKRKAPGSLKGMVDIPKDFNEPLEDLKDYM